MIGGARASYRRRMWGTAFAGAFVVLVIVNFAWFWPIYTGDLITTPQWLRPDLVHAAGSEYPSGVTAPPRPTRWSSDVLRRPPAGFPPRGHGPRPPRVRRDPRLDGGHAARRPGDGCRVCVSPPPPTSSAPDSGRSWSSSLAALLPWAVAASRTEPRSRRRKHLLVAAAACATPAAAALVIGLEHPFWRALACS